MLTFWVNAKGDVNGLVFDLTTFCIPDFDPERIKENDGINRLQSPVLSV